MHCEKEKNASYGKYTFILVGAEKQNCTLNQILIGVLVAILNIIKLFRDGQKIRFAYLVKRLNRTVLIL